MKRVVQIVLDSDSDSDNVWDYKSLKREKKEKETSVLNRKTQSQNTPNKQRNKTRASLKNDKQTDSGNKGKRVVSSRKQKPKAPAKKDGKVVCKSRNSDVDRTANCPSCQVPFSALSLKSPTLHVYECLDVDIPDKACPEGISCSSTLPDHYWKFNHRSLAMARVTGHSDPDSTQASGKFVPTKATLNSGNKVPCTSNKQTTGGSDSVEIFTDSESSSDDVGHMSRLKEMNDKNLQASTSSNLCNGEMSESSHNGKQTKAENPKYIMCDPDVKESESDDKDLDQMIEDAFQVFSKDGRVDDDSEEDYKSDKSVSDIDGIDSDTDDVVSKGVVVISDEELESLEMSSKRTPLKEHKKISIQPKPSPTQSEKSISLSQGSLDGYFKCASPISPLVSLTPKKGLKEITPSKGQLLSSNNKRTSISRSSSKEVKKSSKRNLTCQNQEMTPSKIKVLSDCREINATPIKKASQDTKISSNLQTTCNSMGIISSDRTGQQESSEAIDTIILNTDDKDSENFSSESNNNVSEMGNNSRDDNDTNKRTKDGPKINAFTLLMNKNRSQTTTKPFLGAKGNTKPSAQKNAMDILMNSRNQKVKGQESKKNATVTSEDKLPRVPTPDQDTKNHTGGFYGNRANRQCPFYKKMPDTQITVDAFSYGVIPGCRAYFLSHFHYDHYTGLTKKFQQPIYCSKITANLVQSRLRVDGQYVNALPMEQPTVVEGVEVTLLEANHCPGAVLFLFKLRSGKVYLHTGDFRAHPCMESYPALVSVHVHQLYLDTTYCDPSHTFPPQKDVIEFVVSLVQKKLQTNPKTLIVCGSYTIGKERIFTGIAEALQCKICVQRDKKNVLDCLEDEKLRSLVSLNLSDSNLHVLPMAQLRLESLQEHLCKNKKYTEIMAFEPTGWTHSNKIISLDQIRPKINRDGIQIYGVPYSEHSSYLEMKRFVQFIKADKILPTVSNGNARIRQKMEGIFKSWMDELKMAKTTPKKQASINNWVS